METTEEDEQRVMRLLFGVATLIAVIGWVIWGLNPDPNNDLAELAWIIALIASLVSASALTILLIMVVIRLAGKVAFLLRHNRRGKIVMFFTGTVSVAFALLIPVTQPNEKFIWLILFFGIGLIAIAVRAMAIRAEIKRDQRENPLYYVHPLCRRYPEG